MADESREIALNQAIDDAKADDDLPAANEAYRQLMNVEADPEPVPYQGNVTVETDRNVSAVAGVDFVDFANNPAAVANAWKEIGWWDQDDAGLVTGDRMSKLRAEWGSDAAGNLEAFARFASAHPDVQRVCEEASMLDHPLIVRIGAMLGRKYGATTGTVLTKGKNVMSNEIDDEFVSEADAYAEIDGLQAQIDRARAMGDSSLAQELYMQQQRWYEELPGGQDSIIGSNGRTA